MSSHQSRVGPGPWFRITVTITNGTSASVKGSRPQDGAGWDTWAQRGGKTIWRWNQYSAYADVYGTVNIPPGRTDSQQHARSPDGQVPPGIYQVRGLAVVCDEGARGCPSWVSENAIDVRVNDGA
jgi:hypothetical protein